MKNRLDYLTNLIDKYLVGVDHKAIERQKEVQQATRIRLDELEQRISRIEIELAVDAFHLDLKRKMEQRANLAVDALPSCYDDSSYNAALDLSRKMQIQVQKLIDARDNQMHQEG